MSERAPYSRLYWSLVDDPKFASIYDDNAAFAWWVRLLMIADQAWPASAHLPVKVSRRIVSILTDAGLLDLQPAGRYRVHGLDGERNRRKAAATRDPSGPQQGPNRDPDGLRTTGLRRDETRGDEQRQDETGDEDPAVTYMKLAGHFPGKGAREWLDNLSAEYGSEDVSQALAAVWPDATPATAIGQCQDRLKADARAATRRKPRYGLTPEQQAMAAFLAEKP